MQIKNVLYELQKDNDVFSTSALLFDDRWVMIPGIPLLLFVHEKTGLPSEILNIQPLRLYDDNYYSMKATAMNIVVSSDLPTKQRTLPVKHIGMFSSKNIHDTNNFPIKSEIFTGDHKGQLTHMLSLFFLFDTNMHRVFDTNALHASVKKFINVCTQCKINRGARICIESAPFANRHLLASHSNGIVANLIGNNNCFMLTDAPTAPGSEGGIVFYADRNRNSKIPIGIVISSLNSWKGEHIGFTLNATMKPLLEEILNEQTKGVEDTNYFNSQCFTTVIIDLCLARVECGNEWGTAVLWDKENGIFITAAHVIRNANISPLKLIWQNNQIPCTTIYKNCDKVYDIAVLRCHPRFVVHMRQIPFASTPVVKGETVLAAGFPIFPSNVGNNASISRGNVSLCDDGIIHTNCCVLPGASGGIILRTNGELLGIIVCHTTLSVNDKITVYPKINMAVPVLAIMKPLNAYIQSKDTIHLEELTCEDEKVIVRWKPFQSKL